MTLIRYEPMRAITRLQDEINRLFSDWVDPESTGATAAWVPPVDIMEFEDRFELMVDLPGVAAEKVDITLERGVLTLSGERPVAERKDVKPGEVIDRRLERGHGRFYRRFILPDTVDAEKVQAKGHDGVLAITIPKLAKAMPRRIKVAA